jgi:glycosyltransferase involved in cell wall biosynthesis
LGRVFESLCAQRFQNFEWLVVDDGSTDGTGDSVREWQRSAPFPVEYIFQQNRGKHRAYNEALCRAKGELFTVVDSDDAIVPAALERLSFHWHSIPDALRPQYSGVTCLSMDRGCRVVGTPFPRPVLDCRHYELETRFGVTGEKWGCHRTAVLRQFPFPRIDLEKYCPEGLVWNRIGRRYLVRHVNEALRLYLRQPEGITANWAVTMMKSPRYARLYYRECLGLDAPFWWTAKRALNYVRFSMHAGVPAGRLLTECAKRACTAIAMVPGLLCFGADLARRVSHVPAAQMSEGQDGA